ncbi:MAG TPA: glycosyltransferase family 4 protein [Magnetovibrio sp.]
MTRSLLLSYVSPEPERQGHASYTHVHEIINGLRRQGWQVDLFCPRYDEGALPGALTRLLGIGRAMLRAVSSPRTRIYYMRWHFAAFPVALYAKLLGIPTVIEVNGPVDDLFIAWPVTRRFRGLFVGLMESQLRWASAIVAVTDGLASMCRTMTDTDKAIVTIPNGANTDQFSPDAAEKDNAYTAELPQRFMVFFGTMAPWQGIRTVLAALDDPAWPADVHAVFAGDGMERPAVEAAAARLSYAHYLGRVPYDVLPTVTARALGSFVCTENLEGRGATGLAPLKLFESLASGVPVIATEMPFQAAIVKDGACGYVVPAGDAAELARTVAKLAADQTGALEMGKNARAVAVRDHSWAARARDTHDILVQLLDRT